MFIKKVQGIRRGYRKRVTAAVCAFFLCSGLLTACGGDTKVVLTTALKKNEVFRIGDLSCTLPEVMVYLTNMQNQYEAVFGEEIWNAKDDEGALEKEAKEQILAELAQVKAMTLLAQQKGIELDEKEEERAAAAGKEYYQSLNETEVSALGVDEKTVVQMYREYALAKKVYQQIVENVNPEISDDEARTITVLQIRLEDREKAQDVCSRAQEEGADFESLAENNSEDPVICYSFGKGEVNEAVEAAAFDLGKDEVSGVIEADGSYYILKCISTFDEAQTQLNKVKIVEQRRNEAFHNEYNAFVDSLTRQINEELWDSVAFIHDENVNTSSFFEVYNTYFVVN
ncbi:MAG: peptidyl-prolyl cis-trans isomerase [Eubacteriales bacterium]|nr:peptidyl-prolyl cis-trans isomerase [Eubacteriales bacterium]